MKKVYNLLFLLFISSNLFAQNWILKIDSGDPVASDKTGHSTVTAHGGPWSSAGVIVFPTADDYLIIDTVKLLDINGQWKIETRFRMTDSTNEFCLIDFRSTSATGNMYLYYNRDGHGIHFGDRNLNGGSGCLIEDGNVVHPGVWTNVELLKAAGHLVLKINSVVVADSIFSGTLSPLARTTIGYSEDRREPHAEAMIEYLIITYLGASSAGEVENKSSVFVFENPVSETGNLKIMSDKKLHRVSLFDMNGRLVKESSSNEFSVADLNDGPYVVRAELSDGRQVVRKLMK